MIHNLIKYLESLPELAGLVFRVDALRKTDTDNINVVRDTGGATRGDPDFRVDATVQVTTRNRDKFQAEAEAFLIYSALRERFRITLPGYETGVSDIEIAHVHAVARPYFLQIDESGLFRYVANYVLVFVES